MSYARARLWLGIGCVGTIVVVSALMLLFHVPARLLSGERVGMSAEIGPLAGVLFAYAFLSGPFDFFGGYILPKEYGRTAVRFPAFLRGWLRGTLIHSLVLLVVALLLLKAAQAGGFPLLAGAFLAVTLVLLATQSTLALALGGFRFRRFGAAPEAWRAGAAERKMPQIIFAESDASYFTGGIAGLPGLERVIVPERWQREFSAEEAAAIRLRRTGILDNGSRWRGLALAIGWNFAGFCLACLLSGGGASVAGLVTGSLWFTLWSFLGLLLLPPPSQRGVFSGDAFALRQGAAAQTLETVIQRLDRDQDDEPARERGIETYFHPIPSVERRLALLDAGGSRAVGCWHGARMAIYLSWAGVSFLSRAVHCNCGRPDVWVFLPCD